jgi:outer membrane protein assembly factor BamB
MDITERLLRITPKAEKVTSFFYLPDGDICPCNKEEWLEWLKSLVKAKQPDFIFSRNPIEEDIGCEVITSTASPIFKDLGGVHYIIMPDDKTQAVCDIVKEDLEKAPEKKIFLNVELKEVAKAIACVFSKDGGDYGVKCDNAVYMNTSSCGCVREVVFDAEDTLSSNLFYFTDKREQVYKMTWKTVLESRGTPGRPCVDGEYVYIPTANDGFPKTCGVYKLDGRGGIVWKCSTENSVNCDLAVGEDVILAVDCEGRVYYINKEDGKIENQTRLSFEGRYAQTSLTSRCGVAYAVLNGKVFAIDINKETVLWENADFADETVRCPDVVGKILLCGSEKGMVALCRKTGEKVWEQNEVSSVAARALPIISNRFILSSGDTVYIVSSENGEILGGKRIDGLCFDLPSQPLLRGGLLYIAAQGKDLAVIDVADLIKAKEKIEVVSAEPVDFYMAEEGRSIIGDILYIDGYLTFTTKEGFMNMVHLETKDIRKNLNVLSGIQSSPSYVRLRKSGRTHLEAFVVTSSLCGKVFGNRL